MNTFLSTAQEAQVDQYRACAKEDVAPIVDKLQADEKCVKDVISKLAGKGYLGLNVPKEHGGSGGTLLDVALFAEAIGQYDAGLGLILGNHAAVIEVIKQHGSQQQIANYLPKLAKGEVLATLAFSEENAGTDFAAVETTLANKTLSGKKTWVISANLAGLYLVLAKASDALTVMLLESKTASGLKLHAKGRLIGLRSASLFDVDVAGVAVAEDAALKGDGKELALEAMDVAKVVLSAAGLGMIENALRLSAEHANQRQQFGTAIGQFQGVQWKLADMYVDELGSRLQVYRAAWSFSEQKESFRQYAAMCKWLVGRSARIQTGEAVQIFGASGLMEDGPVARFYDDGKAMEIVQGTGEFQKMLLVKELNI